MNKQIKDITGQTFGRLTVVGFSHIQNRQAYWLCHCECGKETIVSGVCLRKGNTRSCGCLQRDKASKRWGDASWDLTGQRFGRVTVIRFVKKNSKGNRVYLCRCDCGKEFETIRQSLVSGHTQSCGCKRNENFNRLSHGKSYTNIYRRWLGMKQRCYNHKVKRYEEYGGRGIKVCEEWLHDPLAFYNWAIQSGYATELTLDRIDVNGDYSPQNCRWVDIATQNSNTRRSHRIEIDGTIYSLKQMARKYNISYPKLLKVKDNETKILELVRRTNG